MLWRRNSNPPSARRVQPPLDVPTARHSRSSATGQVLDLGGSSGRGGSRETNFWAKLSGAGPTYTFVEYDLVPLAPRAHGHSGEVVEVNDETGLNDKIVRVYLSEGKYTTTFNRLPSPPTCEVCVTLIDYDTGAPIAGAPVWLGGFTGTTDASGTFCATITSIPAEEVGGAAGDHVAMGIPELSEYHFKTFCVPCGGEVTVAMHRKDRWVQFNSCCITLGCDEDFAGRSKGMFPRTLYGAMAGPEPVVGTGGVQPLIYRPEMRGATNGWYQIWTSDLFYSGAYGACEGCHLPGVLVTPPPIIGPPFYRLGGWCGKPLYGRCSNPYSWLQHAYHYPRRTQRDKKFYYPASRITFALHAQGGILDRGGVGLPTCDASLILEHFWDSEGVYPARGGFVYEVGPECDSCRPQSGLSTTARAIPGWPVCDNAVCECGRDPSQNDWFDPSFLDTSRATTYTPLSSTTFCGPLSLTLTGEQLWAGCGLVKADLLATVAE